MRVINEVLGDVQVSMGGRPNGQAFNERPAYTGAYVEITVSSDNDNIEIEGNLASIKRMCEDIIEQLEILEEAYKNERRHQADTFKKCDHCGGYFDPARPIEHGDGQGFTCLGDGTVLMGDAAIWITKPPQTDAWPEKVMNLKKGDRFEIESPWAGEGLIVEALDNPFKDYHGHWRVKITRPTTDSSAPEIQIIDHNFVEYAVRSTFDAYVKEIKIKCAKHNSKELANGVREDVFLQTAIEYYSSQSGRPVKLEDNPDLRNALRECMGKVTQLTPLDNSWSATVTPLGDVIIKVTVNS